MSTVSFTENGKGTDYYLRSFYGQSRSYRKSTERGGAKAPVLATADANALRKALREIGSTSKDDEENARVQVSAFVQAYNNMMDAAGEIDDSTVKSLKKQITKLAQDNAEDLEAIGITVTSSGTMKVTESHLKDAVYSNIEKVFGSTAKFNKKMSSYQKKLGDAAESYAIEQSNRLMAQKKRAAAQEDTSEQEDAVDDIQAEKSIKAAATVAAFQAFQAGRVDTCL